MSGMTYEQAVAWLQQHTRINVSASDTALMLSNVLAVLEREHEEAEWYKERATALSRYLAQHPTNVNAIMAIITELSLRAERAARKGVSDER